MNIDKAYPSKWLKAADLDGHQVTVQVDRVVMEDVSGDNSEEKPVMYFKGKQKGLILNKTNAGACTLAYGPETDEWTGKPVILYPDQTMFQGKMVACLRLRVPIPERSPDDEETPF